MAKQIEMNYKLDSGYEVIYPNILLNNVIDWVNNIYSKSEIDNKVDNINQSITNAQMTPGGWNVLGSFNFETGRKSDREIDIGSAFVDTSINLSIQNEYWLVYQSKVNFLNSSSSFEKCYFNLILQSNTFRFTLLSDDAMGRSGNVATLNLNNVFSLRPARIEGTGIFQLTTGVAGGYYTGIENNYFQVDSSKTLQVMAHFYTNADSTVTLNVIESKLNIYSRKINSIS